MRTGQGTCFQSFPLLLRVRAQSSTRNHMSVFSMFTSNPEAGPRLQSEWLRMLVTQILDLEQMTVEFHDADPYLMDNTHPAAWFSR